MAQAPVDLHRRRLRREELHGTDAGDGGLARRAAKEICRRVGEDGHSVAQVARELGVGWATAMDCVRRHGEPLVDGPGRIGVTEALGIVSAFK